MVNKIKSYVCFLRLLWRPRTLGSLLMTLWLAQRPVQKPYILFVFLSGWVPLFGVLGHPDPNGRQRKSRHRSRWAASRHWAFNKSPQSNAENTRLQTIGFFLEEYRNMRLLKCDFLNSHHSFPLLSTQFPRRQTEKSTKQEMCFIPAFENGVSRISPSPQLTAHTCQQAPKLKKENSSIFQSQSSNPRVSGVSGVNC